jgi:predicted nucleotidyltransferase component of viral defense system
VRDHLLQVLEEVPAGRRLNPAREYLQTYLLRLLHEVGAFEDLAFVGGTALRLLHRLPRFSEDLDFSVLPGRELPEPEGLFRRVKVGLEWAAIE